MSGHYYYIWTKKSTAAARGHISLAQHLRGCLSEISKDLSLDFCSSSFPGRQRINFILSWLIRRIPMRCLPRDRISSLSKSCHKNLRERVCFTRNQQLEKNQRSFLHSLWNNSITRNMEAVSVERHRRPGCLHLLHRWQCSHSCCFER